MTQDEANRLIDGYIDQAVKCQDIRDKCQYESAEYWQWHERALS